MMWSSKVKHQYQAFPELINLYQVCLQLKETVRERLYYPTSMLAWVFSKEISFVLK